MSKIALLSHGNKKYIIDEVKGKWKYRLRDNIMVETRLPYITKDRETDYYSVSDYMMVAKRAYAFDGVTGASWLEDPDTLFKALFHDILMQAIYDDELLDKKFINDTHKIFLIDEKNFKSKFIYASLMALHKPWNKINSIIK